jgi:hypothetical protein
MLTQSFADPDPDPTIRTYVFAFRIVFVSTRY